MRKHCLQYIFHSKVKNYGVHIKYRQKLIEGIENPSAFNHIKDFWLFDIFTLFNLVVPQCCPFTIPDALIIIVWQLIYKNGETLFP